MRQVALVANALDRVGAAVHPLQHAPFGEQAQVAAYGLRGDLEVVGQCGDLDPAVVPGTGQDLPLTLVSLHLTPLPGARCPGL